jgi:hypothetical protein
MDNITNDMPLHPAFVAFVDRAARYLSGNVRPNSNLPVDSFIQLRTATTKQMEQPVNVEVVDPDGHRPLSLSEASSIKSYPLTRAGFYQVRFANGRDALVAVNPDRRESDLEPIPKDVQKLWSANSGALSDGFGTSSKPMVGTGAAYRLWWYCMLILLAVTLAQSIIAANYLGTNREDL